MGDDRTSPGTRVYPRETLEFERVAFFSDAFFAISMTLLVIGLDVPSLASETSSSELWTALGDAQPKIIIFAVLGSFWMDHHRYGSRLVSADRPPTPEATRWQRVLSLVPALYFLATVPLAFALPSTAIYSWILLVPISWVLQRRMPKVVADYFDE
jgi:uncharacterized membrane protein